MSGRIVSGSGNEFATIPGTLFAAAPLRAVASRVSNTSGIPVIRCTYAAVAAMTSSGKETRASHAAERRLSAVEGGSDMDRRMKSVPGTGLPPERLARSGTFGKRGDHI